MVGNPLAVLLVGLALVSIGPAEAQQQANIFKIGWLGTRPGSGPGSGPEVIRRELSELGYVDGKNANFEHRYSKGKLDRLPELADELVRLKVDIILTSSTPAARAVKKATGSIPIVFYTEGDPVVAGLVETLSRPGGNITGFTSISPVIVGKRLELLKETVPRLSRVVVLWTRGQSDQSWEESQVAARQLGLHLYSMEVTDVAQVDGAIKEAIKEGDAALAVTPSPVVNADRKLVADLAAKYRLPGIYPDVRWTNAGGLLSYGADRTERYRRVASMVDKIFKGRKPRDIPVEQPTKFELVINLKTAKQIGLTIPPNVLARADRVIR